MIDKAELIELINKADWHKMEKLIATVEFFEQTCVMCARQGEPPRIPRCG